MEIGQSLADLYCKPKTIVGPTRDILVPNPVAELVLETVLLALSPYERSYLHKVANLTERKNPHTPIYAG